MSKNNRILIADKMHYGITTLLEEAGFDADYRPEISREEILLCISDYLGLIIRSKTEVDQELVEAGGTLKFVARAGAGMDKLDADYLTKKNIKIINAPEGNRDAVGEHVLGLLLNLLNKISSADREVKDRVWRREENRGMELSGKVVGIYGFGNAGNAFARKLAGMECEILAYDKYKSDFSNQGAEEVDLKEFRNRVEVLSLHIPLKEETKFLFNKEEFEKYPKLKIILNTARGEILKLCDVIELLERKVLWGVGLDVLENENLNNLENEDKQIFDKLISFKNVLLTPHVAGWTQESYERINRVLVRKVQELNLI